MAMNFNIDTSDLERIERPAPQIGPPLDLQLRPPFYQGALPTNAVVNPDAVRNFTVPNIPSYRIIPAQALNIAGANVNTTAAAVTAITPRQPVPAPTIAQSLTSIPTGYTFAFNQVRLPMGSTTSISSYKVYRNTTNSSTSAAVIQSVIHHQANIGVPVTIQDSQPNGVTQFYFVSAVNISGIESTLTPAQAQGVTIINNAGFNANSQLASSFHNSAVNTAFAPTSQSTLSNDGLTLIINIASCSNLYAPGLVSYNSGTVSTSTFSTWYVYADDPLFQGGPVIYQATNNAPFSQVGAEGRLPWGKITTANGSAKTGGGYAGGSTGIGAGGGRGYIQ